MTDFEKLTPEQQDKVIQQDLEYDIEAGLLDDDLEIRPNEIPAPPRVITLSPNGAIEDDLTVI